jgi:hypothetical protein
MEWNECLEVIEKVVNIPFIVEIVALLAPTLPLSMQLSLRAVLERVVSVPNFFEKMYLIFSGEQ